MPLKNSIKIMANIISFEMNIVWSRLVLWLNIVLITIFSLLYYESGLYSENPLFPNMGRLENLSAMAGAIKSSSNIYVIILTITCVFTWSRFSGDILKTLLSLPISRKIFFICNIINIFLPPYIIFLSSHIFAGTYILNRVLLTDIMILIPLILLQTLLIVSIVTLISLILKNSIISLFLVLSIFTLPSQFPELKYIDPMYFYKTTLTYIWGLGKDVSYLNVIELLGLDLSITIVMLILSLIYFLKMDID